MLPYQNIFCLPSQKPLQSCISPGLLSGIYGIPEYNKVTLNKGNKIVINDIVITITGRGHNIMMGTK